MDFITEEVKKASGLTDEQIEAIKPLYESDIATKKQSWDNKANTDAEGILQGAAGKVEELTNVKRTQGEKVADYIIRAGNEHLTTQKAEVETLKTEYAQKLKDFDGGEEIGRAHV